MAQIGWVKIHRKIMETPGYFTEPFCRNMAFVDLILLANHKPGMIRKRGVKVDINRGDVGMGSRELAERWKWSRGKVLRFLNELESDNEIVQQKNNVTNCITIVNYSHYQNDGTTDSTTNGTTDGTQIVPQTGHKRYQNKNVKNDNNENKEKEEVQADKPQTFKKMTEPDFYNSIAEFKNDFPKEMLRAFFDYWSEKDSSGKMKFQFNKTWELKKRLNTWSTKNYNNGTEKVRLLFPGGNGSLGTSAAQRKALNDY